MSLLYLYTEISEPLLMIPQLLATLVLLFLYFIILVFWPSDVSTRKGMGSVVVVSLLSFFIMITIWRWQNSITKRRADIIIQQVYSYQKQHGHYPDSLAQLVPKYLAKVSSTAEGLFLPPPFRYRTFEHQLNSSRSQTVQHFSLHYYPGSMVEATYSSRSQQWHYDD